MIFKKKSNTAVKNLSGVKGSSPKRSGVSKKGSAHGNRAVPSGRGKTVIDRSELFSMIEGKAYEFYLDRACAHGNDQADWFRAEREITRTYKVK